MKKTLSIFVLVILSACAVVENPTGGPVDRTPPLIIQKLPPDSTLLFRSQSVTLVFNEFIALQNPEKQIILNPFTPKLKTKLIGKKLVLILPDSLHPHATYSISFLQAIKDITEGNYIPFYQYVFSTAEKLDTCKLHVKVLDPINQEPQKDVWVGLYKKLETFEKIHPMYTMTTFTSGMAEFNFLPKDTFYVTALQDVNFNHFYDLKDEKIGFSSQPVIFSDTGKCHNSVTVYLFSNQPQMQKRLKLSTYHFQSAVAIYALPLVSPSIAFLKPTPQEVVTHVIQDSLFFFVKNKKVDSLIAIVNDTGNFQDTLRLGLKVKTRGKNPLADTLVKIKTNLINQQIRYCDTLVIQTSVPIDTFYLEKIILYRGQDSMPIPSPHVQLDRWRRKLYVMLPKSDSTYTLEMKKGALVDLWGFTSDSLRTKISILSEDKLGSLTIVLQHTDTTINYLGYLKRDNQTWVIPFITDTAHIKNLFPGSYTLQLLIDKNHDGKWTNGSWEDRIEPEIYLHYPAKIEIKGNWENRVIWKL